MPGELLLDRTVPGEYWPATSREIAGSHVRPLVHNGQIVGRATIAPEVSSGCVAVGGFRVATAVSVAGILLGDSTRASREEATVLVPPEELARWATEQAALLASAHLPDAAQAKCARLIGVLGGDAGSLALVKASGIWLRFEELVEWSRAQHPIIIIDEVDEERALQQLSVRHLGPNVLVEPSSEAGLYVPHFRRQFLGWQRDGVTLTDQPKMRPVLRAIAAAWAPADICVLMGEFSVDRDERIYMDVEQVTREDDEYS